MDAPGARAAAQIALSTAPSSVSRSRCRRQRPRPRQLTAAPRARAAAADRLINRATLGLTLALPASASATSPTDSRPAGTCGGADRLFDAHEEDKMIPISQFVAQSLVAAEAPAPPADAGSDSSLLLLLVMIGMRSR